MSFFLEADDIHARKDDIFVFDLEWIGDVSSDPRRCKLWEIGCVHCATGDQFRVMIMPALTGDNFSADHNGSDQVPPVTRQLIAADNQHLKLKNAISMWEAWVSVITQRPIMISHNCFCADLPVLNFECMRCTSDMSRWSFMDSLSYVRYALRGRTQKFGIADLCTFLNIAPEPYPHRALQDAIMLSNILRGIQDMLGSRALVHGTAASLQEMPLQAVRGIGNKTALDLRRHSITSIWDLYNEVMRNGLPFIEQNIMSTLQNYVEHDLTDGHLLRIAKSAIDWARKLGI